MVGREILLAASLLLLALAPVGALAADIKTQSSTQYLWYNDPFHALDDPDNTVVFPGNKADFFSGNRNLKGGVCAREGTRKRQSQESCQVFNHRNRRSPCRRDC